MNVQGSVSVSGVVIEGHLPDLITKQDRSYQFFLASGVCFGAVLVVVQAEHSDVYAVEELTVAEGEVMAAWRVFAICKADLAAKEWLYEVRIPGRLNGTGRPSCQCWGYNRHQYCKHIGAFTDLVKRGQL